MKYEFGVTATTDLQLEEIRTSDFRHGLVVDLRCDLDGKASPIDEAVLRKLRNFHIGYQQFPVQMDCMSSREENELFRMLTENHGNVLVVADDAAAVAQFCNTLNIPVRFKGLYLVEAAMEGMAFKPESVSVNFSNLNVMAG